MESELIDHASFEKLRLGNFVDNCQALENWEFMGDTWLGEAIGFTQWLRPAASPTQTQSISLDLESLDPETIWKIFEQLGLELEAGMTLGELEEEFGSAFTQSNSQGDRTTLEFLVGSGEQRYCTSFTVHSEKGLVYFTMMNHAPSISRLEEDLRAGS